MSEGEEKDEGAPPPEAGATKYRDIAELGRGGMGHVYLCVASGPAGFSKLLVVKRLRPDLADDPELLDMFMREARLAARLSHPNIVQTNEVGSDAKGHFIAMEYLDGQSLHGVLGRCRDEKRTLPRPLHLRALSETLAGLHYAHELADFDGTPLNCVHRDATPHNIFITYDGQVKLVDFGIAKISMLGAQQTTTGVLKGKVHYMAPEQVEAKSGSPKPDRRADVFSVGVMLWEAATGIRMWKGRSEPQIINMLMNGAIPRPRELAPDIPERLEAIVMKALERNPDDRYPTAEALQLDLDAYLDSLGEKASTRELGRFVATMFADTRAELRVVIEQQLRRVRELPSAPVLDLSDQPSQLRRMTEGESGSKIVVASRIDAVKEAPGKPPTGARVIVVVGALAAAAAAIIVLGRSTSRPDVLPPTTASPSPIVETVGTPPVATTSAASTAPSATAIPSSATPPPTDFVQLTIDTVPANAKLMLDGAELRERPVGARYVRDGAAHKVSAEAPGYAGKTQWVTFDQPQIDVHLVLLPLPKTTIVAPPPLTTIAPGIPPPPTTTIVEPPTPSTTTSKPKLPIDKGDPWDAGAK
jgi:serine/threonine protein kinase